jgi:DNA polymerase III delta prime subunit
MYDQTISQMSMRNWYEEIDKKLLPKRSKLKNTEQHGFSSPYFLLISGRSGLGKTNALIELLHRMNGSYDKIVLCCMSFASDPLYVAMKQKNPSAMDIYEGEVPSPDDYIGDKGHKLFICDDMVGKKQFAVNIADWFVRGRKAGADMCFITQSFYDTDRLIRRSLSNLFLFPSSNKRELGMILREYPFLADYNTIVDRYKRLTKGDGPSSFMNVNIQHGTACIDFEQYNSSQKKRSAK